jgi:hypothetical protein
MEFVCLIVIDLSFLAGSALKHVERISEQDSLPLIVQCRMGRVANAVEILSRRVPSM